ncbi:glycosyltransferase [Prauserella sp. PE36]|uniref:nucleotide disphospho-sugar-binding domain-containing protein n=1 Tax=Prauserella sp. PE36 TaxID=1504709 RepID=UPI000DE23A16|nr:nucleotide disphospho-sugar-binding domain-containing protein [Prauserella sp. PE36]RBM23382.1 glycosyltransferase [Prauserella sp. PE36]
MRVLLVSAPLLGHAFPLVPLARALRAAGHDVLVATGGPALAVRDAGIDVAEVGSSVRFGRSALRIALTRPRLAMAETAGEGGLEFVSRLFAAVGEHMAGEVLSLAGNWKPDLVVHEPLAAAGALAAARQGVPSVVHDTSLYDGADLTAATVSRMGHSPPPPMAVLRTAPPSLAVFGEQGSFAPVFAEPEQGPADRPQGHLRCAERTEGGLGGTSAAELPLRPVPFSGEGPVPEELRRRPDAPRILVSRSTVAGPGGARTMAAVARVAAHVDAEFVLVRPPERLARRPLPPNVRVTGWVPIPEILPTCSAIVHHGGAGTLLAALAAGVPQLIEPGAGDRARHARLVAERGAGLASSAKDVTSALLTTLVTDPALAEAAAEVQREIAAMPSPQTVAQQLTDMQ